MSPLTEASKIPVGTYIRVIAGDKDENTLPKFSEAYVAALKERWMAAPLKKASGSDHGSVRRAPELYKLASEMVLKLSRP